MNKTYFGTVTCVARAASRALVTVTFSEEDYPEEGAGKLGVDLSMREAREYPIGCRVAVTVDDVRIAMRRG